jgi:hypothetical protein
VRAQKERESCQLLFIGDAWRELNGLSQGWNIGMGRLAGCGRRGRYLREGEVARIPRKQNLGSV